MRRSVVLGGALVCLLAAGGALGVQAADRRSRDRTVCASLGAMATAPSRAAALERVHQLGEHTSTRLGHVVRAAEGDGRSLELVSEDYDYVLSRCKAVGEAAPNVDPAYYGAK